MTGPPDLREAFRTLSSIAPEALDADEVTDVITALSAIRAWCDALEVRVARRQRALSAAGSASACDTVARVGRRSSRAARQVAEREQLCERMPRLEAALAAGRVSSDHVDAVAAAARRLDERSSDELATHVDQLLDLADRGSVDGFERSCRQLARSIAGRNTPATEAQELEHQRARSSVRRWIDRDTGMHHTHLELDPVRDTKLWSAIDAAMADQRQRTDQAGRPWSQLQVDAVLAAVSSVTTTSGRRRVPELTVLIDLASLTEAGNDTVVCETAAGDPLPASTVRAMACDADIIPVVLGGRGEVLDVGRSRRLATAAQRRAVYAMHRTCVHPSCAVPVDQCRIHHVRPWQLGGRTDLAELAPVCERHHHEIHEGGWHVELDDQRRAIWRRPDGAVDWEGPSIDRAPAVVG